MKKYQHIFFDLDHTLWDFEKNSALAFEKVLLLHNIDVDLQQFLQYYVPLNRLYWEKYRNEQVTQAELRYGRLRDTFNLLNYSINDNLIETLSKDYVLYLPKFNFLHDGTIEILEYLKPKYSLHIITNGFEEVQAGKIENSGLKNYFTSITNSEMAGVKKPNAKIFEFALSLANAKKNNSIMIGDCLEADIQGALNFGIDAIFFNENFIETPKEINAITHLLQLKNIL
jgi:YjjG family noncanonical pyrimidine nucleotidase